jgi:mRNA interferase RelE/StbE
LKGYAEYRRSDIGEFRIIYRIKEDTVIIALVGKRNDNEVYNQFSRQKK